MFGGGRGDGTERATVEGRGLGQLSPSLSYILLFSGGWRVRARESGSARPVAVLTPTSSTPPLPPSLCVVAGGRPGRPCCSWRRGSHTKRRGEGRGWEGRASLGGCGGRREPALHAAPWRGWAPVAPLCPCWEAGRVSSFLGTRPLSQPPLPGSLESLPSN